MNILMHITLAEVLNTLLTAELPEKRGRDLASAIRCAAKLLHRQPSELPADIALLRERLAPIHHVQAGISPKRLANIKADLAVALRLFNRVNSKPRPQVERTPEWTMFMKSLQQPWQRNLLARLADYCSLGGLAPDLVDDDVLARFRSHLSDQSLAKDPNKVWNRTIQTWNGFVKRSGLPQAILTVPANERYQTIALSAYPRSFQADLDAWLNRLTHVDLFAEEGPRKALRPHSLRNVRATVRQFATALVARDHAIESITSLATLVELEAFKDGLRFFIDRNAGKLPTWLWGMAGTLLAIARHHVKLAEKDINALSAIRARLKIETDRVTDKNKHRLNQFDDLYNVELLILLPSRLSAAAEKRQRRSSCLALDMMHAVAIEILLVCPVRMGNLASLDIKRHFRWHGKGNSQTISLSIPGAEVKNGVAIEADFPPETTSLIRLYLKSYRNLVSADSGDW